MEYITKKIPRSLVGRLTRLKSKMQLKGGRRVTEGEVISLALERLEEEMEKEYRYSIKDLIGIAKGGPKSSAKEIDKIVYGV